MDLKTPDEGEAPDSPWGDLVVSILSVNQYSLDRTYNSIRGLREQGLADPGSLSRWTPDEIEKRLRSAGCDRGAFMTKLFASRLSALGGLIQAKGSDECSRVIEGTNKDAISSLLSDVKGIGPVVLRNFYLLRGISTL